MIASEKVMVGTLLLAGAAGLACWYNYLTAPLDETARDQAIARLSTRPDCTKKVVTALSAPATLSKIMTGRLICLRNS